jgi:hypothetical protein
MRLRRMLAVAASVAVVTAASARLAHSWPGGPVTMFDKFCMPGTPVCPTWAESRCAPVIGNSVEYCSLARSPSECEGVYVGLECTQYQNVSCGTINNCYSMQPIQPPQNCTTVKWCHN